MKKLKLTITAFCLLLIAQTATAQITHNYFSEDHLFSVLSKTTDANGLDIPMTHHWRLGFLPIKRIEIMNTSVGYQFDYDLDKIHVNLTLPLKNLSYLLDNYAGDSLVKHSVWGVSPMIQLEAHVTDEIRIIAGAAYDYNFFYSQKPGRYGVFQDMFKYPAAVNNDIENVNQSGFVARLGIGFEFEGTALQITYNHRLYDYFNPNYTNENNIQPYTGWTSKIGYVSIGTTQSFAKLMEPFKNL